MGKWYGKIEDVLIFSFEISPDGQQVMDFYISTLHPVILHSIELTFSAGLPVEEDNSFEINVADKVKIDCQFSDNGMKSFGYVEFENVSEAWEIQRE